MPSGLKLLSLLTWLPIAGGVLLLLLGERRITFSRWLALAVSFATFVLSIPLFCGFDGTTAAAQFVERAPWIAAFNAEYYLGVDGISMPLILLTTFTTVLVLI